MGLCVLGRGEGSCLASSLLLSPSSDISLKPLSAGSFSESLDELTSMVVQLFGEVENKNVPVPEFPEHPFQEEQLRVSFE